MLKSTKNQLIGKNVSIEGTISGSITNPINYLLNSNGRFEVINITLHHNDSISHLDKLSIVSNDELPIFYLDQQKIILDGIFSENWGVNSVTDIKKLKFINNPTNIIKTNVDFFSEFYKDEAHLNQLMFEFYKNNNYSNDFSFDIFLSDIFYILTNKKNADEKINDTINFLLSEMSLDIRDIDWFKTFSSSDIHIKETDIKNLSKIRGHSNIYTDNAKILLDDLKSLQSEALNLPNLNILKKNITELLNKATKFNDINNLKSNKSKIIDFVSKATIDDSDLLNQLLILINKSN